MERDSKWGKKKKVSKSWLSAFTGALVERPDHETSLDIFGDNWTAAPFALGRPAGMNREWDYGCHVRMRRDEGQHGEAKEKSGSQGNKTEKRKIKIGGEERPSRRAEAIFRYESCSVSQMNTHKQYGNATCGSPSALLPSSHTKPTGQKNCRIKHTLASQIALI